MATTSIETRPTLAVLPEMGAVRWTLGSLRGWIRCYVWAEGLTAAVAWLGIAFWVSLVADWFFEPPVWVRVAVLAVVAVVFCGVLYKKIGRRAFVRLSDANMATLLERRYGHFDDSLLTAVLLTGRSPDPTRCNPDMLDRTCREAAGRIGEVALLKVFNFAPLLRVATLAVLLAGSVTAFAALRGEEFNTWVERTLLLSGDPWPRKTCMEIEGFADGIEKVARGADFEVIARAHTQWPPDHPRARARVEPPIVPAAAQIRYRFEGGRRQRKTMNRLGIARTEEDPFQKYSYTFQGVLAPIAFTVKGNDHVVGEYRIVVVDSPTIDRMTLDYQYPAYMDRSARTFSFTGVMQVPFGTRITARADANKELDHVQLDTMVGEDSLPPQTLAPEDLSADGRRFVYSLPPLFEDATLLFTLSDTDEITSREPFRLVLSAVPDEPPQLAVRLHGIGAAITAKAGLPAEGRVTDDYGIKRVWFHYQVDDQSPAQRSLEDARVTSRRTELPLDGTSEDVILEVGPLGLAPGQKLLVSLKASDHYDLAEKENVGTSERWLLDIVTPEELHAMLVRRELVLRQRFERIIQEVTETQELLMRMEFADSAAPSVRRIANPSYGQTEEKTDPDNKTPPVNPLQQLTLRTQQARQMGLKNAHETQGVAEAFDDVRRQFVNNKIHTEELVIRLKQRIADPLHRIAGQMFPEWQLSLQRLEEKLGEGQLDPGLRDAARRRADDILMEMEKALQQMIELEEFNEALELLRTIIKLQQQLDEETKKRHKETIRGLLED